MVRIKDYRFHTELWRMIGVATVFGCVCVAWRDLEAWHLVLAVIGLLIFFFRVMRLREAHRTGEAEASIRSKNDPPTTRPVTGQVERRPVRSIYEPDSREVLLRRIFFLYCGILAICFVLALMGQALRNVDWWRVPSELGTVALAMLFPVGLMIYGSTRSSSLRSTREAANTPSVNQLFGRRPSRAKRDLAFAMALVPACCGIPAAIELNRVVAVPVGAGLAVFFAAWFGAVDWRYACALELDKDRLRLYTSMTRAPRAYQYGDIVSLAVRCGGNGKDLMRLQLRNKRTVEFAPTENRELQLALDELRGRLKAAIQEP